MKIISFNVNGIRARLHQLQSVIEKYQPDIIGLQETKVTDEDFPLNAIRDLGYHVNFHGQKTHYGVALLSLEKPEFIQKGFKSDEDDAQKRLIVGDFKLKNGETLRVINGYFPQGENQEHQVKYPAKRKFFNDLQTYLVDDCSPSDFVAVIGDFNVAPTDQDIGIGDNNAKRWLRTRKCSFLPEERDWFSRLLSWGLVDSYRQHASNTELACFSWFDYRSRGFEQDPKRGLRIDGILASKSLNERCQSVVVDYDIRAMEKPSDHAPVVGTFSLG